jgi:excisionase family DNA binding protein
MPLTIAPLAYSVEEACEAGRTGRTSIYEAINAGELRAVKRGRRTLILVSDLHQWLSGLPAIEPKRSYVCDRGTAGRKSSEKKGDAQSGEQEQRNALSQHARSQRDGR